MNTCWHIIEDALGGYHYYRIILITIIIKHLLSPQRMHGPVPDG